MYHELYLGTETLFALNLSDMAVKETITSFNKTFIFN